MRLLTYLFLAVSLLLSPNAHAVNAEDDISIEIRGLTKEALTQLRGVEPQIDLLLTQIESQLPNLQAYFSDEPLIAETSSANQTSIALNFPKYGLILFDRLKWPMIQSRAMKQAIALHEVASLMGIEATGVYFLSSAFLVAKGLTIEQMQTALNGGGAAPSNDGSLTCDAALDQLFFRYEVWHRKFEMCLYGGFRKHQQLDSDESDLVTASERVARLCHANQKKLSASSKIQTIIGTLKAKSQGKCGL